MRLKHFIVIVVILALPITFSFTSERFADNLRVFSYSLIKPILQITHAVSWALGRGIDQTKQLHQIYQENERLRKEVAVLRNKQVADTEVFKENERLRGLLDFKKEVTRQVVPAQIIARDISFWSRWIVLDKGAEDGVSPGMTLVSQAGLLGRVISVGKHISRAILIIDGESRVSVTIQTTRDTGLLEGRGDGPLGIKLLPVDSKVKVGDAVITSGLGGSYPKGIPVGYIQALMFDKDGLHMNAVVKPFAEFNKIEEVLCLNTLALS